MLSTRNHLARIVLTFMTLFVMGCSGGGKDMSQAPPIDDTRGGRSAPSAPAASPKDDRSFVRRHPVITLVGAAAAYYMYKKHQNASAQATGPDSQYYLSKHGRVYYRDANHQAHWVTPPPGGIRSRAWPAPTPPRSAPCNSLRRASFQACPTWRSNARRSSRSRTKPRR